ncbi:MAG: DUF3795 domain-containing protein [Lachnospiraceae bacterium]|nr:DUF3795 domain-containing protein [Lachnospiraceae bacterium]
MNTYCGKNCEECTYKAELSCTGCQSGPGRAVIGDCKLAHCCRDKGHTTCDTCELKRNCGKWLDKGSIPKQRIERRIELQKEQEIIARRAPFLGKWLWILFWLVVPSEISGIMTMDKVVEAFPLLRVPGLVLGITCSLVYSLILLRISSEHESYRLAGLFGIGSTLLEVFMLVLGSTGGLVFLISLIKIAVGLLMTYHEYKAHGESVYPVDADLSECWEKLWKWKLYSIAGLAGSVILTIISRFLGVVLLFASIIFMLVISVFKLIYLYQTAQAFRSWTR